MPNNIIFRFIFLAILIAINSFESVGQGNVSYTFEEESLESALTKIEEDNQVQFYYVNDWIDGLNVNGTYTARTLEDLIDELLFPFGLSTIKYNQDSYIFLKALKDGQVIESRLENGEVLKKMVVGDAERTSDIATVKGHIKDAESGEPVVGATLYSKTLKKGTASDYTGNFEISLPAGEHIMTLSSVGFHEDKLHLVLFSDGQIEVSLVRNTNSLDEVTITGQAEKDVVSEALMSMSVVEMKQIEYVPSLLGERDVVKTIALLPGVVSGEGTNGYSVRGSNLGQNLLFVDGAPVYNSAHLFGLFSIFNPGVIENTTIYKGTMPVEYGGRVASVMNINVKDGRNEKIVGEAGIGLISSRLNLEGPLSKKMNFVLGGRVSYINRYLDRLKNSNIRKSRGGFYDVNAKLTYSPSDNDLLSINSLLSNDDFTLPNGDEINYNTGLASLKWSHTFSKNSINHLTLAYSTYESHIGSQDSLLNRSSQNRITTGLIKSDFSFYSIENHSINVGLEANFTNVDPGKEQLTKTDGVSSVQIEKEHGLEVSVFAGDEFLINDKLTLSYGLRFSNFFLIGSGTSYQYESQEAKSSSSVIDSTTYSRGELIQSYGGLEPRLFVKYAINNDLALKFNAGRSYQYIHLVSNAASVSPLSIWKLSDTNLRPQKADQASIGIFRTLHNKTIELSSEVFVRKINDLPDYKNGAVLINNPHLDRDLVSGTGRAYGAEFQVIKKTGKLSGLLAYSFTRSLIEMKSSISENQINGGEYYASDYDIPHNLSVTGDYQLTRTWSLSFNWLYNSGRPISYPEAIYNQSGTPVLFYNKRNEYRMPDYHRLDLSLNWKTPNLKIQKNWDFSWSFSVYNAYGRSNAYSIYFVREGNLPSAKKLSILANPVPSVTLNIKML
ncbi:TonB-dependent Receptor Plug Domain [Reichenbachiella faecimaris]|uniref:TonB-dependent Receptor Plug Domain n=1 Tax=Reichenbachiella faecimaris TaxID=692418 RepID=A0A1W2G5X3_REIFA|nr:TonB-dependent receptor [Reichenbachiella faecimaris]SMD31768.1 TonB-dependent Receptor Plug Domain [Reichenbachiella faecimaris]